MKLLTLLSFCMACSPTAVKIGGTPNGGADYETDGSFDPFSGADDDAGGGTDAGDDDGGDDGGGSGDGDGADDGDTTDPPPFDGNTRKWTIMVYLAGDNNLEDPALVDLNEMEIAGSTEDVNILVEIDRAQGYSSADGDWTGARRYLVEQDDNRNSIGSSVQVDLGEVDSGSTDAYIDFVEWGVENFPAEQYALIIWNHGWGWTIAPTSGGKGISSDDQSGNSISIANGEYEEIIAAAAEATGDRLSMVGMDACLMANWEIARITAEYADVYVASQATESIAGWAFDTALSDLINAPNMDAAELGTTFADRFHETGDSTLSVVDLEELKEIDGAIDILAEAILTKDNPRSKVRPQARRSQKFDGDPNDKDFRDFLQRMTSESEDTDIADASEDLDLELDEAILANFTNGGWVSDATGLSIYIPTNGYDEAYLDGRWNEFTRWAEVVEAVR